MSRLSRSIALVALACLSACSAFLTDPTGSALESAVKGQWIATQTIAGNFLGFTLGGTDTTLTGAGTFAGEAGPSGTVSITGVVSGKSVTLHFVYTAVMPAASTNTARFVGTLEADRLSGSMKYGPEAGSQPESAILFNRVVPR